MTASEFDESGMYVGTVDVSPRRPTLGEMNAALKAAVTARVAAKANITPSMPLKNSAGNVVAEVRFHPPEVTVHDNGVSMRCREAEVVPLNCATVVRSASPLYSADQCLDWMARNAVTLGLLTDRRTYFASLNHHVRGAWGEPGATPLEAIRNLMAWANGPDEDDEESLD